MGKKVLLVLLFLGAFCQQAQAQEAAGSPDSTQQPLNRKRLAGIIAAEGAFYVAGISYLQFVWYKDHDRTPFHFYNDAKGYQQVDKLGHVYGSYVESYIGYHWLRSAGVSRKKALLFGGTLGLVLQTPIEVFDGLYEGYGFSWPDMAANALGSGLVIGNELLFQEQLIKYKFSYRNSAYAPQANGYLGDNTLEQIFLDYNGHTYWLSVPVNKISGGAGRLPDWLSVAVGYSANGMFGEFQNRRFYRGVALPQTERYRQFLLSPDIDWTRIKTNSPLLKTLFTALSFVKLPFPAVEYNSKGNWKGYWWYY